MKLLKIKRVEKIVVKPKYVHYIELTDNEMVWAIWMPVEARESIGITEKRTVFDSKQVTITNDSPDFPHIVILYIYETE